MHILIFLNLLQDFSFKYARVGKILHGDTYWTTCSTTLRDSPSIPLSFNLAIVFPRRDVYALTLVTK